MVIRLLEVLESFQLRPSPHNHKTVIFLRCERGRVELVDFQHRRVGTSPEGEVVRDTVQETHKTDHMRSVIRSTPSITVIGYDVYPFVLEYH